MFHLVFFPPVCCSDFLVFFPCLFFREARIQAVDSSTHPLPPLSFMSAQEFFRGSLSKNPLFSTDIVPSSAAAAAGGGGGGRSGDGAAAGSAAAGSSSSTISGVAEATMRDLRDKIATDLDMADAVRVLPSPRRLRLRLFRLCFSYAAFFLTLSLVNRCFVQP